MDAEHARLAGVESLQRVQDHALDDLGMGEREAIILAEEHSPDVLLLIDETKGRAEAKRRGITSTGTLGVLDAAAEAQLIDLVQAISRLRLTNFHVKPVLLKTLIDRDNSRKKKRQ